MRARASNTQIPTWSCHTQAPMSFSFRVTEIATPPPPATRMLALSGSMAAWAATFRVRDGVRIFVIG